MTDSQNKINTYAENALLTTLRKSEWTGKIKASDLDAKIAIEHNAEKGRATKTDKLLIAKDEPLWKAVKAAGRKVHAEWERWSCPWQDGGTRMIASARFIEFSTRLEEAMNGFNKAVAAFVADYEKMVPRQAERRTTRPSRRSTRSSASRLTTFRSRRATTSASSSPTTRWTPSASRRSGWSRPR